MKIITDKKELMKNVGDWNTIMTGVDYEIGSSEITLKYNGQVVIFQHDNKATVAFYAWQFHQITTKQYQDLFNMKGAK